MDILEKITNLREKKGWSEYLLAEKSGLTQSPISSWYRKNMCPSISSLEKICHAFGITLSQFFALENENFTLTDMQRQIIKEVSHLNEQQQQALISFLKTL